MLTIRIQQTEILGESLTYEWARGQLEKLFPKRCASMGRDCLVEFVQEGAKRAKKLGLRRDDLLPYLSMEICFGVDFVMAERNIWARKALEGPAENRMHRLRRAGVFRLAERVETDRRRKAARAAAQAQAEDEARWEVVGHE
jgi:hypothetical protein